MSQRSITSFFKNIPSKKTTNESNEDETSSISKEKERINSENGKRKREISLSRSKSTSLSPVRKPDAISKKSKTDSDSSPKSFSRTGEKGEQKLKETQLRENKDKTDSEVESPGELKKETLYRVADSRGKEVTRKKRSRITVFSDSSDDEGHLPLPDSAERSQAAGKETSNSVNEEQNNENSVSTDIKNNTEDEDKSSHKKKPEKKSPSKQLHNFFASKQTKTTKGKDTGKTKPLSCSYNPHTSNYHPINDACWKYGERIPYAALTRTLELIEETSARLKIIEILSNYFRSAIVLSPNDVLPSIYLCLNQLAPAYQGIELGVAETNLMKAIAQCTGRTLAQIKAEVQEVGDLGVVAEGSRSNQRTMFQPAPLTVSGVYTKLKEIAQMTGHASLSKKLDKIQTLFVACRFTEARYLIRSLAGKLRVGLAEQSVLQSLALACTVTPPGQQYPPEIVDVSKQVSSDTFKQKYDESALIIKTTYCECPNYDLIVPVLLKDGIKALPQKCKITPGIPLKPMLAHPTKGIKEVLTRFEGMKFTCEWKYDGERAQIHVADNGEISIFSRNQENNTSKYPDIVKRFKNTRCESVKTCILDCEAVAWDSEKKQILPFQILSTRKRKDANEADIKVQVCVFMFDLLYLNGESLVKEPFKKRRQLLKENFQEVEEEWNFATSLDTSRMEEVQDFLDESIKGNCEGLMVKTLEEEATYEIAKRSRNWLKLKKDYLDGLGDTLDVVVIGGYIGKGKRTGTYGGFLLACYDEENEEYQSLCKIGTGFSEEDLQKHTEFFKTHMIPQAKSYYRYDTTHTPDHWFEPVQVWEIKCADLSLSPVHRAATGIVDPEKGISLRFPRFVRVREDKNCEQATSAQQVAAMYHNQEQIKNQTSGAKVTEEEFY